MNTLSPSTVHRGPVIALIAVSLVLILCAVMLVASVASGSVAAGAHRADGPLLAPFRWDTIASDLA